MNIHQVNHNCGDVFNVAKNMTKIEPPKDAKPGETYVLTYCDGKFSWGQFWNPNQ